MKWYWEAVFRDTHNRYWKVGSDIGFATKEEASEHLAKSAQDGSIADAGVPCGSVLVNAEAVLR